MSRHRVALTFDDGVYGKLICPDDESCKPSTTCGACGAALDDPEAKRCYDCEGATPGECWVKSWFDNCTVDELLHGELTVEIAAEWDGDRFVATIEGEVPAPDKKD